MFDEPRTDELLAAVARLLREEIVPELKGALAFNARVAANALDLVRRQVLAEGRANADEHDRLVDLLGRDGPTMELNQLLVARLRAGAGEAELPGLMNHLWETTLAKIAVDQPGYASIEAARALRRFQSPEGMQDEFRSSTGTCRLSG